MLHDSIGDGSVGTRAFETFDEPFALLVLFTHTVTSSRMYQRDFIIVISFGHTNVERVLDIVKGYAKFA